MEVTADADGKISGSWTVNSVEGNSYGAFNGIQITDIIPPENIVSITGSESPQVHSPGDVISLTVHVC